MFTEPGYSGFGKFSVIISLNTFYSPSSLISPSEIPIMEILGHLMLSQRCFKLSSLFSFSFSLFYSVVVISTILSFGSLCYSSTSVILLSVPSNVCFISVIVLFVSACSVVLPGLC